MIESVEDAQGVLRRLRLRMTDGGKITYSEQGKIGILRTDGSQAVVPAVAYSGVAGALAGHMVRGAPGDQRIVDSTGIDLNLTCGISFREVLGLAEKLLAQPGISVLAPRDATQDMAESLRPLLGFLHRNIGGFEADDLRSRLCVSQQCIIIATDPRESHVRGMLTLTSHGRGRLILELAVHKEFRRQGIGTALVTEAAHIARQIKSASLMVCWTQFQPDAVSLFGNLGFKKSHKAIYLGGREHYLSL